MTRHSIHRSPRRGSIIHEAIIAMLLATMVIVGAAEVMVVVWKQKREIERRSLARREAANLMEEVMLVPWQELAEEADRELELSDDAKTRLPNSSAKRTVGLLEDDDGAVRITIEVTWGDAQKRLGRPVLLVAWRYRQKEPQS